MADNTAINPGVGGDTIATDDITDGGVANGAKVQRIKNGFGADGAYIDTSAANPMPVTDTGAARPGTSAVTSVASSAANVMLLAANTARKQAVVFNESTQVCYVKLGVTASATSYTYQVQPGGFLELPRPVYTGQIDAIWAAANGNARVTELS